MDGDHTVMMAITIRERVMEEEDVEELVLVTLLCMACLGSSSSKLKQTTEAINSLRYENVLKTLFGIIHPPSKIKGF